MAKSAKTKTPDATPPGGSNPDLNITAEQAKKMAENLDRARMELEQGNIGVFGPGYGATPEHRALDEQLQDIRNQIMHAIRPGAMPWFMAAASDPAIGVLMRMADAPRNKAVRETPDAPQWTVAPPKPRDAEAAILRRNLRRRMAALNLTERGLSLNAGLSDSAVRHVLNKTAKVSRGDTLGKLAGQLGCTVDDLTSAAAFKDFPPLESGILRRGLARVFLEGESMRAQAKARKTGGDHHAATELRARANAFDFIDGPYEWIEKWVAAIGDMPLQKAARAAGMIGAAFETDPGAVPRHGPDAAFAPLPLPADIGVRMAAPKVPVYASAQGGDPGGGSHGGTHHGSAVLDYDPIDRVDRPGPLLNVHDGYGVVIVDDSMSPAYEHGEIAFVSPRKPPAPGCNAVFIRRTDDGTAFMLIKKLVTFTPGEWKVRQHNPARTFSLKRSEWQQCHVIVAKYERG